MTSFALTTFETTVKVMIKASDSDDDLEDNEIDDRIKAALSQYSADIPGETTEDESGDGGKYYAITDLAAWVEGFSRVLQIEYPAATIASDETPQYLAQDAYNTDYWDGATRYIYFSSVTPASGESFRVRYTTRYVFSGSPESVDIPAEHFYAICTLAACKCCRAISAKFSRIGDSFVTADAGAHTTKANEFATRANDYCAEYRQLVSLPPTGAATTVKAASGFTRWESDPEYPQGRRYVFHR